MNRRTFLSRAFLNATTGAAIASAAPDLSLPIIDTHIHLYDPTRPQGVPWPPKGGKIPYKPILPADFRTVSKPFGIVGAIEVECSPWVEDNQWVLDVIGKDNIMVGTVGNLEPGAADFRKNLERFHKNKLFLGIRFGYLWGRNLGTALNNPQCVADLKALASAGLELDTFGPPPVLADVIKISDLVPDLRIIIDHLASHDVPAEPAAKAQYEARLREIAKRPHIFIKVSEVLRNVNGRVPYELSYYRPRLEQYWDIFGADRLLFGSDWTNSETVGSYAQVFGLVKEFILSKGRPAAEKFFYKNSQAAYRWPKRDASQRV